MNDIKFAKLTLSLAQRIAWTRRAEDTGRASAGAAFAARGGEAPHARSATRACSDASRRAPSAASTTLTLAGASVIRCTPGMIALKVI